MLALKTETGRLLRSIAGNLSRDGGGLELRRVELALLACGTRGRNLRAFSGVKSPMYRF